MLKITKMRHAWHERAGFAIDRPSGHTNYTFLHFFGSVELTVNGLTTVTQPHACIIYDIATPQKFISHTPLVHDWIHFSGELLPILEKYGLSCNTVYYPRGAARITAEVRELENEFYADRRYQKEMLELQIEKLFITVSRGCSGDYSQIPDKETELRINTVRSEVFSNLSHNWSVWEMARNAGLSESRFYALYKSVYSTSPTDDLIKARIDAAKGMLQYSTANISEIAESLGYNNITHFMRQFKSLSGTTPLKYRRQDKE